MAIYLGYYGICLAHLRRILLVSRISSSVQLINQFLVPILYPLKTPENQRISGIFRGCKMGILAKMDKCLKSFRENTFSLIIDVFLKFYGWKRNQKFPFRSYIASNRRGYVFIYLIGDLFQQTFVRVFPIYDEVYDHIWLISACFNVYLIQLLLNSIWWFSLWVEIFEFALLLIYFSHYSIVFHEVSYC